MFFVADFFFCKAVTVSWVTLLIIGVESWKKCFTNDRNERIMKYYANERIRITVSGENADLCREERTRPLLEAILSLMYNFVDSSTKINAKIFVALLCEIVFVFIFHLFSPSSIHSLVYSVFPRRFYLSNYFCCLRKVARLTETMLKNIINRLLYII